MAEKENGKAAKWKFWSMIIVAALGAYASIMASWINARGAKESSVKVIVDRIDSKVLPRIEEVLNKQNEEINKLKDKNSDLRERLAKIEGMFMVGKKELTPWLRVLGAPSVDKPKSKKKDKIKLHRVDMQQVMK